MKKISFLLLSILLLIEIYTNNNNITSKENNNSNNLQQNNTQQNNSQIDKNKQINNTIENVNKNTNKNRSNNQKEVNQIKKESKNTNITNNKNVNKKNKEEKDFNLTESLINFFKETFGDDDKEKKKDEYKEKRTKEEIEEIQKRNEAQLRRRQMEERERLRRAEFESRARAEQIKIEKKEREEKKKKAQKERDNFEKTLANEKFEEIVQISLEKGETEKIYLNLEKGSVVRMAVILTDEEEKFNFLVTGPNEHGRTYIIYKDKDRNFLYYHFDTLSNGEFTVEITNKGSKENELMFFINEHANKKTDLINTAKIDKISMLLNNIYNNMDQLRNKKRIEIKQAHSHNEKVDKNNRAIVIYSILEIFIMSIIFIAQSYYINYIVSKL